MIRAANPDDADWIAGIWNGIIADTLITFTTRPKTRVEVEAMIAAQPVLVLADQSGFATYGPFRSGPGYAGTVEHTIYLRPDAQGQGAGRALITALMDHAGAAGLRVMVAGISGANPGAVAFHAALGFEQVGRMTGVGQKSGRTLDLIWMQKRLPPA